MLKTVRRLITSAILAGLTIVLVLLARLLPELFFSWYRPISRKILSALASASAIFPFPIWEVLLVLLAVWFIYSLIRAIRRARIVSWLTGVLEGAVLLVFAFVAIWGLNHFAPPLAESLQLSVREYTQAELEEATRYYRDMAGEFAQMMPRGADGVASFSDFSDLTEQAGAGYAALAEQYALFHGSTKPAKRLMSSELFGRMGLTGIFVCLTGESCVSATTHPAALPFTICHEIGHRMAIAGEDEANFAAFLACTENGSLEFQYSAYYSAYIYCHNALHAVDASAANAIYREAADALKRDISDETEHYKQYDGKLQDVATAVNDSYLKSFDETGVQSYGEVADLLLAWYFERVKS